MKIFGQFQKNSSIKNVFWALLFYGSTCFSAEIHVAKNGVDALNGRGNKSAPYLTISYVFSNDLVHSGDIIVIHQGVYRETVTINISNVTLLPFEQEKVFITGTDLIPGSSWQADSQRAGVYKTTLNKNDVETDFTQLFVNGVLQQIARYPNNTTSVKKYMVGKHSEMMSPTNPQSGFAILLNASKPAGTDQTGQVTFSSHEGIPEIPNVAFTDEAIIRGFIGKLRNNIFSYSQDGGQVTRAGNRLVTFKAKNTQGNSWGKTDAYTQPEGFGYIMDLSVLDIEGEWFFKKSENTLYYKPIGGTLANKTIEVKKREFGLLVGANDVTVKNIHIQASAVQIKNARNFRAQNCTFTYLYPYKYRRTYGVLKEGIVLDNADNTTFDSCYIAHTWTGGIIIDDNCENTIINNCTIEQIGWMGQFMVAVWNNGKNSTITNNTLGKASRFHIRTTESVYAKITDNDFAEAMAMGEDAGAIMFTSTGKPGPKGLDMQGTEIAYNKVHDLVGIPAYDTTPGYKRQTVVAFYLEDVHNYTVHHNLAYNIKGDNYKSKRGASNNPQSDGKMLYLGPRDKLIDIKMGYYNNTFWNYDKFLTFWHRTETGLTENLEMTNNLYMQGKINSVSNIDEPDLSVFAQKAAQSPLNYQITVKTNQAISNANAHFEDVTNGDFRLRSDSPFNSGGTIIPNITTSSSPALGALEGNTPELRNRVLNAGSDLTINSFFGLDKLDYGNDNISIQTTGEFCPDANNGKIKITAKEPLSYRVTINGEDYSFTNELEISDLEPKTYTFCITAPELADDSCFEVIVPKSVVVSGSAKVASNGLVEFNVDGGTKPYHVLVNNKEVLQTEASSFVVNANHGDSVNVISDKDCEGELNKRVLLTDRVVVYPTITKGNITISLPDSSVDQVGVEVYNMQSTLLLRKMYTKNQIDIDLSQFAYGVYFVKINYGEPKVVKIIKQE
ncbi:right-handed parallel beta-helix repeat-containing protein [Ochrovirga pacifica]|uniref:right-handed parallel beta-helix repeat-containing protein n=1 Tax=Ochrovirga pacifica TaxID=1042376 RepID=UPI000255A84E|nr:T9SS type A sorting domain-containing protein [Ochrovirga pacifica]